MKLRKILFFVLIASCAAGLLLFPTQSAQAARDAMTLCFQTIIPSLFPFFALSSLFISCGAANDFSYALRGVMRPLFGLSGAGASALTLGLLGGYPVGARTVAELFASGTLPRKEAEHLLGFCNNAGPGFILGMCAGAVFHSPRTGLYLYLVHVVSAILTGIILCRDLPHRAQTRRAEKASSSDAFSVSIIPAAVQSSLSGILNVCAFVVLFMVLLRLLLLLLPSSASCHPFYPLLLGFVELSNGVAALSCSRLGFTLCAVLLAWGGLSVHAQTLSVLDTSTLSTRWYWRGKIMQAVLSVPLAWVVSYRVF
ncbi:MAG: sporulation protein [Eubacteriales bacterium]|nr:sporulation protein [Eubacteriales bacterium]